MHVPADEPEVQPSLRQGYVSLVVDRHAAQLDERPCRVYPANTRTSVDGQTNHRYRTRVASVDQDEATLASHRAFDETRTRAGIYDDDGEPS